MRFNVCCISAMFLTLLACSTATEFKGVSQPQPSPTPARKSADQEIPAPKVEPQPELEVISESFDLAELKSAGKIDMVWVIDNSGSMGEEVAQVRRNFSSFIGSLKSRSDVRVILISKNEVADPLDTGVSLTPEELKEGHVQIGLSVGSTNLLAMAAAASCPLETTVLKLETGFKQKICDQDLGEDYIESFATVMEARSKLRDNFRADAKRMYVFVTDDNASGVNDKNFLSALSAHNANVKPFVFSFHGTLSRDLCQVAAPGTAYKALAEMTGGQIFDICDADWSANFDKLSERVIRISNAAFTLKGNIVRIKSVRLDGRELSNKEYSWSGNKLQLSDNVVSEESQYLEVVYELQGAK